MESKTPPDPNKNIFIICPIDKDGSDIRKRSDQVKKHVIDKASEDYGYRAYRSDHIYEPGLIPDQIVSNLEDAEIVVADLSDRNANVFYELAIRQVCGKPVILLCSEDQKAPFDVQSQRIIFYNNKDWDSLPTTLESVRQSIKTIEENNFRYDSPIKLKSFQDISEKNNVIEFQKTIIDDLKKRNISLENEQTNYKKQINQLRNEFTHGKKGTSLDGQEIRIGYISSTTVGLETGIPLINDIIEPDISRYVNDLGYDVEFEFIIDDARGNAAVHLEKVQGLHSMGVNLILGGGWSSQAQASLAYCNNNGLLLVSSTSTSPILAIEDDNFFRMCPTDFLQGPALSQMLLSKGVDKVVVFLREDAWAQGIFNSFKEAYLQNGGDILDEISYYHEETDFEIPLSRANNVLRTKISNDNVDEFGILSLSFNEIVNIVLQAEDYDSLYDVTWFGSDGTALSRQLVDQAGAQADMLKLYSTYAAPPNSKKFIELYDKYYSLVSQPFGYYSACTYDAAWALVKSVLETQSTETKVVKTVLPKICYDMWGASGWCALNAAGDRAISNYQIWGYGRKDEGPVQPIVYGYYDGLTGSVSWSG